MFLIVISYVCLVAPRIVGIEQSIAIIQNTAVRIWCNTTANPPAMVSISTSVTSTNNPVIIAQGRSQASANIIPTSANNGNIYTCIASNLLGTVRGTTKLNVLCK